MEDTQGIISRILMEVAATSGSRGGGTEAMASPKRQTREAKLCFGLPQTGQWVYLANTESTDFTGFVF